MNGSDIYCSYIIASVDGVRYKVRSNGSWGTEKVVYSSGGDSPRMAFAQNGEMAIVWCMWDPTPSTDLDWDIFCKISTDGGTTWGSLQQITETSYLSRNPEICYTADNNLHVIYQRKESSSDDFDLWAIHRTSGVWGSTYNLTNNSSGSGIHVSNLQSVRNELHFMFDDSIGTLRNEIWYTVGKYYGSISGVVKDNSNNALPGATVSTSTGGYVTTTASDGYYFLEVAPGTYSLTASKVGYSSQTNSNISVASGQDKISNFQLTYTNSTPTIDSISISNSTLIADASTQYTVTYKASDTNGVNDIRDMRIIFDYDPNDVTLSRGYLVWGQTLADIQYWGGSAYDTGTCTGGGYWGIRNNGFGYPYVTLVGASTSVSGNQRTVTWTYKVNTIWGTDGPSTGNWISMNARDNNVATGWINSNTQFGLSFAVKGIGNISGTVKDSLNNALSGAVVSTTTGGYSATTNTSGAYTLSNVVVGTYSVVASKTNYYSQTNSGVVVTANQTTTSNFNLSPQPGTISGTVKDATGANISGAAISTTSGGYSTISNSSGSYTLTGVAIGTYTVTATKNGFGSASNTGVSVSSNQTTTSNFVLNKTPIYDACTMSSGTLIADGSTEYTVTLKISDIDGVNDIRDVRVLFNIDPTNPDPVTTRGYLIWGQTLNDVTIYGGSYTTGSASGGGYWGFQTDSWGYQYITPVGATTSTNGNQRIVTWTFKVNPAWGAAGPLTGNYVGMWARDNYTNTGWTKSSDMFGLSFGINALPTFVDFSTSGNSLTADGTTQHTVTLICSDNNSVSEISNMRVLFNLDTVTYNQASSRGYLIWGQTLSDVTKYGGTYTTGSATGGGYWGFQTDAWGYQYITPVSCTTGINGSQRTVTWTFKINPIWATNGPLTGNYGAMWAEDALASTGWHKSSDVLNKTFAINAVPSIDACTISNSTLIANDSTQYTATLKASDINGVSDIKNMRILFNLNTITYSQSAARGYLIWGATLSDVTKYGGSYTTGSASGGGYWGFQNDGWGYQYITPVGATTSTNGNQRTVTWTFKVKPLWATNGPLTGNYMGMWAEDTLVSSGWFESDDVFGLTFNVSAQ